MRNLLVFLSALFLVSCGSSDKGISFPAGDYVSNCFVTGSGTSSTISISIPEGFASSTTVTTNFTAAEDCTGASVAEAPEVDETTPVFSDVDLGGGVSYFTDKDEMDVDEFVPFLYSDSKLYIGAAETDISSGAATIFASFIAAPTTTAQVIFTKQ